MFGGFQIETVKSVTAGSGAAVNVKIKDTGGAADVILHTPPGSPSMYFAFGLSTDAATSASAELYAGQYLTFTVGPNQTHLSVLSSGASTQVKAIVGRVS